MMSTFVVLPEKAIALDPHAGGGHSHEWTSPQPQTGYVCSNIDERVAVMARIAWIEESEAAGELAEAYAVIRKTWPPSEAPAELFKAMSHRPAFMRALSDATLMTVTPGALAPAQHEMIALVVSASTGCRYCAYHHKVFLQLQGALPSGSRTESLPGEQEQRRHAQIAEALYRGDVDAAPISDAERSLLRFVEALTRHPDRITDEQVQQLRWAGCSDPQIAEAVYTCALYNAFVRITNAFDADPHDIDTTFGAAQD